jgi:hypothetical protein
MPDLMDFGPGDSPPSPQPPWWEAFLPAQKEIIFKKFKTI